MYAAIQYNDTQFNQLDRDLRMAVTFISFTQNAALPKFNLCIIDINAFKFYLYLTKISLILPLIRPIQILNI